MNRVEVASSARHADSLLLDGGNLLKSGPRWVDAPDVYGPRNTLYNRFVRWFEKGVWAGIFDMLSQTDGPVLEVMTDSAAVRAHQVALGRKGGSNPCLWPSSWWFENQNPRLERQ